MTLCLEKFLKIQQGLTRKKKQPKKTEKKKATVTSFTQRGREDVEASNASFDKASKNTVSTLTRLHLYRVNAAGTMLSFLLM